MTVVISCTLCGRSWHDGDEEDRLHIEHGPIGCPHERAVVSTGLWGLCFALLLLLAAAGAVGLLVHFLPL